MRKVDQERGKAGICQLATNRSAVVSRPLQAFCKRLGLSPEDSQVVWRNLQPATIQGAIELLQDFFSLGCGGCFLDVTQQFSVAILNPTPFALVASSHGYCGEDSVRMFAIVNDRIPHGIAPEDIDPELNTSLHACGYGKLGWEIQSRRACVGIGACHQQESCERCQRETHANFGPRIH